MAFDNSAIVTLRERPVPPRHHWDSTPQPSDCEATTVPWCHWDALLQSGVNVGEYRPIGAMVKKHNLVDSRPVTKIR